MRQCFILRRPEPQKAGLRPSILPEISNLGGLCLWTCSCFIFTGLARSLGASKRVRAKRQEKMKPASLSAEDLCVARLAEFFPEALPVRIPVRVTRKGASRTAITEDTTIEFGTQQEVLFASGLSLDC